MNTACLDSVTLIHVFKEILPGANYTEKEQIMSRRAKALLHYLQNEDFTIIVPAIVVNEYLAGVSEPNHAATLSSFQESFEMPPFDLKAAALAAKLWRSHRSMPANDQGSRIIVKADVMIIATAKAFGATHYYSDDRNSIKIAKLAGLKAFEIPEKSPYLLPEVISPRPSSKRPKRASPPPL